jgi:hypothetical protein
MEHPFMPDISEKTVDELQASMSDLTGKLTFAHRMNQPFMINQIQMVLDGYKNEYAKRMDEMYKKQNIQNNIQINNNKS